MLSHLGVTIIACLLILKLQIRSGEFFVHIKYPYVTTRFWHLSIEKYKLNVDMCVLHSRKLACDSFSWNQCYICQQTGTSVHRVLPKTAGHGPCHCWSYNHGEYIIKKEIPVFMLIGFDIFSFDSFVYARNPFFWNKQNIKGKACNAPWILSGFITLVWCFI